MAIAAVDNQLGLGAGGRMAWRAPEDLARFRRVTMGHAIIIGRTTFDAIGRRPLPGRANIVVSSMPGAPDGRLQWASSPAEALDIARNLQGERVFVGGGAAIYAALADDIDRIDLTRIPGDHSCDVRFPIDLTSGWILERREPLSADVHVEEWARCQVGDDGGVAQPSDR